MVSDKINFEEIQQEELVNSLALSSYYAGLDALHKGLYDVALQNFNTAIELDYKFYNAYLQKFYTLQHIEMLNHSLNNEIIDSINKCIEYGPRSGYPFLIKGTYLQSIKKFHRAIETFKQGLEICQFEIPFYQHIIECYKSLHSISDVVANYELALSKVEEYTAALNRISARITGVSRVSSKTKFSKITSQLLSKPQYSFFFADICAEYAIFMKEIDLKSKSYQLISLAVENSNWDEYIEQRIKLAIELPESMNIGLIKRNLFKDFCLRKQLGGVLWENPNLYLYNLMKGLLNDEPQNIPISLVLQLYKGCPLSIIQWCILKNKIHDLSIISSSISSSCNDLININNFMDYLKFMEMTLSSQQDLFHIALMHYYLGSIASSFVLFDDYLDVNYENLSSKESYFYAKLSKELGVDFIPINSYGINKLLKSYKTDEDFFFLGLMYLLDNNKENAYNCFKISKNYKYSRLMLAFLSNEDSYKEEISMFNVFNNNYIVDMTKGVEQFMDIFILHECYGFISMCSNSEYYLNVIPAPRPLWDMFGFDENFRKIISEEIYRKRIVEDLQKELSNYSCDNDKIAMNDLLYSLGLNVNISAPIVANLISKSLISQNDICRMTIYLYKENKINAIDFINLNLYNQYIQNTKSKKIFLRTIIFGGCAATSYFGILYGMLFSTLFYYFDNSIFIDSLDLTYSDFCTILGDRSIELDNMYEMIKKRIKTLL